MDCRSTFAVMKRVGVIGCGWLGAPLLSHLRALGYDVFGTYRSQPPQGDFTCFAWAGEAIAHDAFQHALTLCDAVVVTIPPQRGLSDAENIQFHRQIAQRLSTFNENMHVIYTSSTSAYGDREGACVEHAADHTSRAYGIEKAYHMYFENTTILRFGGLVGPQRQPGHFFKVGQSISQPSAWVNMTHQADALAAIAHVLRLESYGIFNVVSPEHVSRRAFYTKAFAHAALGTPVFTEDNATGKRVLSDKIMHRLGFAFQYASPLDML